MPHFLLDRDGDVLVNRKDASGRPPAQWIAGAAKAVGRLRNQPGNGDISPEP